MSGVDSQFRITRPFAYGGEARHGPAGSPSGTRKAREATTQGRLALTDPAVHVVTDFISERPVTVPEALSIDDALREMIRVGVRALLVVRDDLVTGLITSYDIQGERPLQFLTESGYRRHDEIEVGHIMTPWERIPTLDWQALGRVRVSDLATYFRHTAVTHVVLVERTDQERSAVRGLISRTRLERQLGHPI